MEKESLFSLELVVEKLYIPHAVCRFPALAFRLLDFPNILIEHVEPDLARNIKYKISRDPYFKVPEQFAELKDKHGNFMIRKGKSCLFKVSAETMRMHLTNTPLYVMVIDSFEKVPKLIGNSTLPLDDVMNQIVEDIKQVGNTVPSVHGDKGLFKIYSLMGKEIGYVVLGYRLLSLGPGLIPHIPDSAVAKRMHESNVIQVQPTMEADIKPPREPLVKKNLNDTQEMGSMTEPEKQDVMLQTVDMIDKEIHVAISAPEVQQPKQVEEHQREYQTMATQTVRNRMPKRKSKTQNALDIELESDDGDDIFFTNIVQPPVLFYNSKNEPKVKIHRQYLYDNDDVSSTYTDDLTIEDLSEEEKDISSKFVQRKEIPSTQVHIQNELHDNKVPVSDHQPNVQHANFLKDFSNISPNGPIFPILTALLKELSSLQNPEFVQQTVQQVQAATRARQDTKLDVAEKKPIKEKSFTTTKVQSVRKATKIEPIKENIEPIKNKSMKQRDNISLKQSSDIAGKQQKGWIRKAPETGVKKSKLSYGLTNTQRLRLAKTNPEWLKNIEKEENEARAAKGKPAIKAKSEVEDFPTGEISDTLTEVRRLAQKNLNADDTLAQSDMSTLKSTNGKMKSGVKIGKLSPGRKRSKSPKYKKHGKGRSKSFEGARENSPHDYDEGSDSNDDVPSQPSQRSIEVRIPSVQYHYESDQTVNESDNAREDKRPKSRFPGFADHNASLPESIDGNVNNSLNEKESSDSPLESTRNEKYPAHYGKANVMRSTEDYETQQFQSTEEPELQRLISSGEISDVMSSNPTDKSKSPDVNVPFTNGQYTSKFSVLNPKSSMQSPIPALRRSQARLDASGLISPSGTPRGSRSPSPAPTASSKFPTPRPRKLARERRKDFKQESVHTESVSSYFPSDGEEGNYSDDFQGGATDEDSHSRLSTPDIHAKKRIATTKLGYTIY